VSEQKAAIRGHVTSASGKPVSGAAAIIESGPTHLDITALTGAQGDFSYEELEPGTYTLTVYAPGYAPQRRSARLVAGQIAQLDFTLADQNR
jgi:hypothetical protein